MIVQTTNFFVEFDVGENGMHSPRLAEHCAKG
jgi:hypothetical protein